MKVYFIGSAGLLAKCAALAEEKYGSNAEVIVFDVKKSGLTKAEIFEVLEKETEPSFVFSINNPYIIPRRICEKKELTLVNLHHSLLPLHPGRNGEAWTIFSGDEYGGITWHMLTAGVDAGNIICQRSVKIDESTTSMVLLRQCEQLAIDSFKDTIMPFEELIHKPMKQQEKREKVNFASDRPNDGVYDLTWNVRRGLSFLNAMNYGILNVLGIPEIRYRNKNYSIANYKYFKEGTNDHDTAYHKENNKEYLEISDQTGTLKLQIKERDNI